MFDRKRLPNISDTSWSRIEPLFQDDRRGRTVMAHELASAAFIPVNTARALLFALAEESAVRLFLAVYYRDELNWRDLREFEKGELALPASLPNLDEPISDRADLSYEMVAEVTGPVHFR